MCTYVHTWYVVCDMNVEGGYLWRTVLYTYEYIFFDGYCSTVQGLLDWFEVDLGFTELLFIQIDLCVMRVCVLYSPVSLSSCPFFGHPAVLYTYVYVGALCTIRVNTQVCTYVHMWVCTYIHICVSMSNTHTYSYILYVTWLLHMWHDSFICDMTRSYVTWLVDVWHDSSTCAMTHSYVTGKPCRRSQESTYCHGRVRLAWLVYMWHDSFICEMTCLYVTWLVDLWCDSFMCAMTHSNVIGKTCRCSHKSTYCNGGVRLAWLVYMRRDSFIRDITHSYVTWFVDMCHDSSIRQKKKEHILPRESTYCMTLFWTTSEGMCDVTHSYWWHDPWLIHMRQKKPAAAVTRARSAMGEFGTSEIRLGRCWVILTRYSRTSSTSVRCNKIWRSSSPGVYVALHQRRVCSVNRIAYWRALNYWYWNKCADY